MIAILSFFQGGFKVANKHCRDAVPKALVPERVRRMREGNPTNWLYVNLGVLAWILESMWRNAHRSWLYFQADPYSR